MANYSKVEVIALGADGTPRRWVFGGNLTLVSGDTAALSIYEHSADGEKIRKISTWAPGRWLSFTAEIGELAS